MTNGTNIRDEVYKLLDKAHKGRVIAKGLKSVGKNNVKAQEEREKYGIEYLLTEPQAANNGNPYYNSKAEIDTLPDDEKRNVISLGFADGATRYQENSIALAEENLEAVLKDGEDYRASLANSANIKDIVENAPSSSRDLMESYLEILSYNQFIEDLKAGKADQKQREQMRKVYAQAAYKRQYNALVDMPEDSRDLAGKLAAAVASSKASDNELIKAAEDLRKEAEEKRKKKDKDYIQKVAEGVGNAISKLINSGDREKQEAAMNALYRAERGYQIGEKDFAEVFP